MLIFQFLLYNNILIFFKYKMSMKLILPIMTFLLLFICKANSVCVKNNTEFKLYYEIQNQNTRCPVPRLKFHNGFLDSNQMKCHAHSAGEGDDWQIYRHDLINILKVTEKGEQLPVCTKKVDGIINILEVNFSSWSSTWGCYDRHDDEE